MPTLRSQAHLQVTPASAKPKPTKELAYPHAQQTDKKLTYYVSHIHYNYWLNLNIPIILVARISETEKTFWQQISEQTLKKTKKQWKLEIPLNQEFSSKSKKRLTQILSNKTDDNFVFQLYSGKVDPDSIFDIAEDVNCIAESIVNVNAFINLLGELKELY